MNGVAYISLNGREKPKRKASKRSYARNPKNAFEDPVFKASEVRFFAPDYDGARTVMQLMKENGRVLREGCIESVRYLESGGRELVEFTCSPTSSSASVRMFRVLVEAECIEKQAQRRAVNRKNPV